MTIDLYKDTHTHIDAHAARNFCFCGFLTSSLPRCLASSLPHCLTASLPRCLTSLLQPFLASSLPDFLAALLPHFFAASLPRCLPALRARLISHSASCLSPLPSFVLVSFIICAVNTSACGDERVTKILWFRRQTPPFEETDMPSR